MRISILVLSILLSTGCKGINNGIGTEEFIFKKTPYAEAAISAGQGDISTLEELIKQGINVNYEARETNGPWGKDTLTLLLWATLSENLEGVAALLKAGADPNKSSRRGMTPLMIASAYKSDELFKLLLVSYKADPNKIFGRPYKSALIMMLQERKNLGEKRFIRAEMLIKYGASINLDLDRGETAIISLSLLGDWRAVYWLLEHGADYEARDHVKATIMCYLRNSYRANMLAPSEAYTYRDMVRDWLLEHHVERSRIDTKLHPSAKCDD